jgi:hypothetical protein
LFKIGGGWEKECKEDEVKKVLGFIYGQTCAEFSTLEVTESMQGTCSAVKQNNLT